MLLKKFVVAGWLLVAICSGLYFESVAVEKSDTKTDDTKEEDKLARVGILPFNDRTQTRYYRYLSESLSDAINESMLKQFSYKRVLSENLKREKYKIDLETRKEKLRYKKRQAKRKGPSKAKGAKSDDEKEEEIRNKQLELDKEQLEMVRKVAKKLSIDIVIFGSYVYDKKSKQLVFTTILYFNPTNSVKKLDAIRTSIDSNLFIVTKRVSKILVNEIFFLIEKAEEIASKNSEEDKSVKQPNKRDKVDLTRKVAMNANLNWASKKTSITISPGFFIKWATNSEQFSDGVCGVCQAQIPFRARFWTSPRVYSGVGLDFGEIWTKVLPFGSIHAIAGFGFVGYGLPVNRWLFSADAGFGYYIIFDENYGTIYNPLFVFRVGAEMLITPSFSLGMSLNTNIYYDQPDSFIFSGLTLTFNYNIRTQ